MGQKDVKILGVRIDITSKSQVLSYVRAELSQRPSKTKKNSFFIATPNPEIVLKAQKDANFKKVLNSANLAIADGYGLVLAAKILGLPGPKQVIHGREAFIELIRLANKKGWKVFLLGDSIGKGSAQEALEKLKLSYKKLNAVGAAGPALNKSGSPVNSAEKDKESKLIGEINSYKPHLLFVAFGAPKQEKWLYTHLPSLNVGGAMVVGGAFDFISGRAKLPPKWVSEAHFEWLWRLVNEPRRIGRVFNAYFVFLFKIIWEWLNKE